MSQYGTNLHRDRHPYDIIPHWLITAPTVYTMQFCCTWAWVWGSVIWGCWDISCTVLWRVIAMSSAQCDVELVRKHNHTVSTSSQWRSLSCCISCSCLTLGLTTWLLCSGPPICFHVQSHTETHNIKTGKWKDVWAEDVVNVLSFFLLLFLLLCGWVSLRTDNSLSENVCIVSGGYICF